MKSLASLLLLALAGQQVAEPQGSGPRGSSQPAAGEVRYDEVGYAAVGDLAGTSAIVGGLAAGGYVEVTALDTGRTILVATADGQKASDRFITLSRAAASALGIASERTGVRVRKVGATPQDAALLRAGQPAAQRADAPPVLLTALRGKLSVPQAKSAPPAPQTAARRQTAPKPIPEKQPAAAPRSGYQVQVATLSNGQRAQSLAKQLGGAVTPYGALFRVQLGPFPDPTSADRARADAVRRGYPDARVVRLPTP